MNIPDRDFEAFLEESVAQVAEKDAAPSYAYIEHEADEMLAQLGLDRTGVDPSSERYQALYTEYTQAISSVFVPEELDDELKEKIRQLATNKVTEYSTAEIILSSYAITARTIYEIGQNDTMLLEDKRKAVATALFYYQLDPNDPLVTFVNRFIPGDVIDVHHDEFFPHALDALGRAQTRFEKNQVEEIAVAIAYAIGVELAPEDYGIVFHMDMIAKTALTLHSNNTSAQRNEALWEAARNLGLPPEAQVQLIGYLERTYPATPHS